MRREGVWEMGWIGGCLVPGCQGECPRCDSWLDGDWQVTPIANGWCVCGDTQPEFIFLLWNQKDSSNMLWKFFSLFFLGGRRGQGEEGRFSFHIKMICISRL